MLVQFASEGLQMISNQYCIQLEFCAIKRKSGRQTFILMPDFVASVQSYNSHIIAEREDAEWMFGDPVVFPLSG